MKLALKKRFLNLVWPEGRPATIIRGPLRGTRYNISALSGWSSVLGRWEPGALQIYQTLIKQKDVVYDLGANTGLHSLFFSKLVGKEGVVFAFEPLPRNIREIEANIALNEIRNIRIVDAAVSSKDGVAEFLIGADDKQGSLVGIGCETGERVSVPLRSLDSLLNEGYDAPGFVKIDVEGAESLVLEGFREWLPHVLPAFSIDLHTPKQDFLVANFFADAEYSLFRFDAESRHGISSLRLVKNSREGWPDPDGVWGNIIAVPSGGQVFKTLIGLTGNA